ncbi:hypothetical protein T484DRAFT_1828284, partial [Baffinella frigidus]
MSGGGAGCGVVAGAVVASSLAPLEALVVYHDLCRAQQEGLSLGGELHLIFLTTPLSLSGAYDIPWARFFDIFQTLPPSARAIGVEERRLVHWRSHRPTRPAAAVEKPDSAGAGPGTAGGAGGAKGEVESAQERAVQVHARFFSALLLQAMLSGSTLAEVSERFETPRGSVQGLLANAEGCASIGHGLLANAEGFASMVATFCGSLRWWQLETLAARFQGRVASVAGGVLQFSTMHNERVASVAGGMLQFSTMPGLGLNVARAFSAAGIDSAAALALSSLPRVLLALRSAAPFDPK